MIKRITPPYTSWGQILIFFSYLSIFLMFASIATGCSESKKLQEVDFSDVIKREASNVQTTVKDPAVMTVAISAMISPKATSQYYSDLLGWIGRRLGKRVIFIQKKTYAEVNDMIEDRKVDVAFVCSGPYVSGHKKFGMELLAVPVVDGKTVYFSYILAHRDSPYKSLDDLRGKKFAFTDPNSNTGSMVPRYILAMRKETPESFFSKTFFTYSHDNSIMAVAEGLADGGAVDHLIWEYMNSVDPTYTSRTKIIVKSQPYGIPPVVVHPGMDSHLKQQLQKLFLSLHTDPETIDILARLHIQKFVPGENRMYDTVREMEAWLANNPRSK